MSHSYADGTSITNDTGTAIQVEYVIEGAVLEPHSISALCMLVPVLLLRHCSTGTGSYFFIYCYHLMCCHVECKFVGSI